MTTQTNQPIEKQKEVAFAPIPEQSIDQTRVTPSFGHDQPSMADERDSFEQSLEATKEVQTAEQQEQTMDEEIKSLASSLRQQTTKNTAIPQVRDELTVQIEKIMEEGLADVFRELTPTQKQEFKRKGEQTANQIRLLYNKTNIKVKKLFHLLLDWLKFLPGINRFFLEQEAKIKADKMIALKRIRDGGA